jgi:hypothetical protein
MNYGITMQLWAACQHPAKKACVAMLHACLPPFACEPVVLLQLTTEGVFNCRTSFPECISGVSY